MSQNTPRLQGQATTPPPSRRLQEGETDEKENRKRMHSRGEPCKNSNSGWQLTSNSRCLVCGRLGASCECRTTRMDPEMKRRKIDSFLLNTPHARCKHLKSLEETTRDESRYRRRLVEQWADGLEEMGREAFVTWRLLLLAREESCARTDVEATERRIWSEGTVLHDRLLLLAALLMHEREARLRLCASAQRAWQHAWDSHTAGLAWLALSNREGAFRSALMSHEAAARAGLEGATVDGRGALEDHARARRALWSQCMDGRLSIAAAWAAEADAVLEAMTASHSRLRAAREERVQLWGLCVNSAALLAAEEATAFAALAAAARADRERRYQHLLAVAARRGELEAACAAGRGAWRAAEAEAWHALRAAMAEAEAAAAARARQCARRREELSAAEAAARHALSAGEHGARFALIAAMAEAEDGVRRSLEARAAARADVVALEAAQRGAAAAAEAAAREALAWAFAAGADGCRRRDGERGAARAALVALALGGAAGIVEEEGGAARRLWVAMAAGLEGARAAFAARRAAELQGEEAGARGGLARAEVMGRAGLDTQRRLALGLLAREAAELHAAQLCEVVAAETGGRQVLAHAEWTEAEHMRLDAEASRVTALNQEAERQREEWRRMERATEEDARMYRESEELPPPMEGIEAHAMGNKSAACALQQESLGGMMECEEMHLRRMFVLRELGVRDEKRNDNEEEEEEEDGETRGLVSTDGAVALRSPSAIAFLASILETIIRRDTALKTEHERVNAAAEEMRRRVANQRTVLAAAKERLFECKERLDRNASEHETRVSSDRETRQREEAQLERERARLQSKLEELRAVKDKVSSMREAIHNQYQRR